MALRDEVKDKLDKAYYRSRGAPANDEDEGLIAESEKDTLKQVAGKCVDIDAVFVVESVSTIKDAVDLVVSSFYSICDSVVNGGESAAVTRLSTIEDRASESRSMFAAYTQFVFSVLAVNKMVRNYNNRLLFVNGWLSSLVEKYEEDYERNTIVETSSVAEIAASLGLLVTTPVRYALSLRSLNHRIHAVPLSDTGCELRLDGTTAIPANGIVFVGDVFAESEATIQSIDGSKIVTDKQVLQGETEFIPHYHSSFVELPLIPAPLFINQLDISREAFKVFFESALRITSSISTLSYSPYTRCLVGYNIPEPDYGNLAESFDVSIPIDPEILDRATEFKQLILEHQNRLRALDLTERGTNCIMDYGDETISELQEAASSLGLALTTGALNDK